MPNADFPRLYHPHDDLTSLRLPTLLRPDADVLDALVAGKVADIITSRELLLIDKVRAIFALFEDRERERAEGRLAGEDAQALREGYRDQV